MYVKFLLLLSFLSMGSIIYAQRVSIGKNGTRRNLDSSILCAV